MPVFLVNGGKAKAQMARPGDILIDDLPRNIDDWRAAGGTGILHTDARSTLRALALLSRQVEAAA